MRRCCGAERRATARPRHSARRARARGALARARSCRARGAAWRCRPRTSRPTAAARCATSTRASCGSRPSRPSPALRDRRAPGARALPLRRRRDARADARAARRRLAAGSGFGERASTSASCSARRAPRSCATTRACRARTPSRSGSSAPFSFRLGPHHLRGRVDRVDRLAEAGRGRVRADRLQDLAPEEAEQLERRHPALALRARRARGLGAGVLPPGLLLRARRPQGARPARATATPRRSRRSCSRSGEGILAQDFEPTPSRAACSICDYRIVCPAAERLTAARRRRRYASARARAGAGSAGIRARACRRRARPRAIGSSSLSAACSRRSTNAWMSGSLCTARPTWRS